MAYRRGESGNPAGKPKGANKTQKLRARLLSAAPAILDALVDQAMTGDATAARLILERCLPALRQETRPPTAPVPTEPGAILASVGAGQMTPEQGEQIMSLLLVEAKIREAGEFLARLDNIERALAELQR